MAKRNKKSEEPAVMAQSVQVIEEINENTSQQEEKIKNNTQTITEKSKKQPKFKIGSLTYIKKDTDADLNGFSLFSQYKKDPYTVEAYDEKSGVYTLRRVKLLVRLKESALLAPDENAHDEINRLQF